MNSSCNIQNEGIANKLPHEQNHLDALVRMGALESYYNWTLALIESHLGRRVLDAGFGIGNFTALLEDRCDLVLAVDLSPRNMTVLRERFADSKTVEVLQVDLDQNITTVADRGLDTVVCLDVLEHVEEDVALMKRFHEAVQPGGHLLVKVPACKWLYGSVDEASDHYRRYSLRELQEKSEQAGWRVVRIQYMNIFGVLPYWLKSRVLRKTAVFSRTFKPWQLALIHRLIPTLRLLDRLVGPPIGQSLILIAVKR